MISAEKITAELQSRILTRVWKPGSAIPSGKELADEFDVSPSTIKKAILELTKQELIWGRRGKGRFVSENPQPNKTWTIGVVLYDMEHLHHPLHSQRIAGIQARLRGTPYHLALYAVSSQAEGKTKRTPSYSWLGLLDPTTLDGVIILSRQIKSSDIEELAKYLPVCTDRPQLSNVGACVRDDFTTATFQATRYLLEMGHRNLMLATISESDHIGLAQREGFRLALQTARIGNIESHVLECQSFSVQEGERICKEAMAASVMPTAIVAGSNELAQGIYHELDRAGLKVPQDISLISWNDPLDQPIPVPMTTLMMRGYEAGQKYVEQLIHLIDHPGSRLPVTTIPVDLIVRESTKPPKAG